MRVETLPEILADKAAALLLRPYLKGRDVWDLYYLVHVRGLSFDWDMVARKVSDYGHRAVDPPALAQAAAERLAREGSRALTREMPRFLAPAALEQYRESFESIPLSLARTLLEPNHLRGRGLGR